MPFGLGATEFLLFLAVLACPAGLLVLGVLARSRRSAADRHLDGPRSRQLAAELDSTQRQLEELEAKLERTEEKVAFTESLLEDRQTRS